MVPFLLLALSATPEEVVAEAVKAPGPVLGETRAVLVIQHGQTVLERYAKGFTADTRQVSWSVAKSITHALVGVAIQQGRLKVDDPLNNKHWGKDDARAKIPFRNWLEMNDGQGYHEMDPRGVALGDAPRKLFGPGRLDVAGYCAQIPLTRTPGEHWNYNSCGLVLVADTLTDLIVPNPSSAQDRRAKMRQWMFDSLFTPLGMSSITPEFDATGLYYGSALIYATPRDFAKLALLYLHDGVLNGQRLLPEGWASFAAHGSATDDNDVYGAGFWITSAKMKAEGWATDAFRMQGHEGQLVVIVPSKDLVIVRMGLFGDAGQNWDQLGDWVAKLAALYPDSPVTEAAAPSSIGSATMKSDGTLVLQLRAEGNGAVGDALLTYGPKDPRYNDILEHLGGLKPGETKPVPPFPETPETPKTQ